VGDKYMIKLKKLQGISTSLVAYNPKLIQLCVIFSTNKECVEVMKAEKFLNGMSVKDTVAALRDLANKLESNS